MKQLTRLLLSSILILCLLTGCGKGQEITSQTTESQEAPVSIKISALSGPTAMGMVKLMKDASEGTTENTYEFGPLATDPSAFAAAIVKNEVDICAIPSNLAANLYNKTNGNILVIAANVYGVVDIVQRGENSIQSLSDLKGHTLYATGQGAVPEYTLRYLLKEQGMDADKDVDIRWCSDTTEALAKIKNDANAIAMLPQPFVTAAMAQVDDLAIALDLNEEWNRQNPDSPIITGCLIVRKDFAKTYPNQLNTFLKEYEKSVSYVKEHTDEAAQLIVDAGIVKAVPIAKKALPACNLACLTGKELKSSLSSYLEIIYNYNPKAVGDKLPADDFYYENK